MSTGEFYPTRMKVELHCHTIYSKDCLTTPQRLLTACRRKGIDRIIVTDHNTILGGQAAQVLDPERVIIGEEIMTRCGELLAFFVREHVPPGLSPEETIARLREQGAFISVSHPFDVFRKGHWALPDLLAILSQVDAIETFNARCMRPTANHQAQTFAQENDLPGTVGSDAHTTGELGKAHLLMPVFKDATSFKQALAQAEPRLSLSPPWIHFTSRYAVWRKMLNSRLVMPQK